VNGKKVITGDWAIDRLIRHRTMRYSAAVAPLRMVGRNPQRVALSLVENDVPSSAIFGVLHDGLTSDVFAATDSLKWFHMTMLTHGNLTTLEWWLTANPNQNTVYAIEYFLPEDVLHLLPSAIAVR